jgi:drug/metabolite transporter superfamily protein YnfA
MRFVSFLVKIVLMTHRSISAMGWKENVKLRMFSIVAILLVLSFSPAPATAQKIRAASGGLSVIHSLLWVAYDQKLLKRYGMDMEYIADL